jgi:hypothetical protein
LKEVTYCDILFLRKCNKSIEFRDKLKIEKINFREIFVENLEDDEKQQQRYIFFSFVNDLL